MFSTDENRVPGKNEKVLNVTIRAMFRVNRLSGVQALLSCKVAEKEKKMHPFLF